MILNRFTLKQVLYSLGLLLIIVSIPITVYLANTKQIFKGKAAASTFSVGFNATGIIHYGYNDVLPYAPASNIDTDLSEINRMGGKIIRIFVANNKISNEETARRLDVFLTKAATYNISAIVSFINFYGDTGFNPQGTDKYYTDVWSGIPLLGDGFYAGGYKNEYIPFVRTVISANKNHTNIYAWEVGNELKDNNSSTNFYNFMKDVTDTIKSLDPTHDIATGNLNSGHAALTPDVLYSLPNIDIVTIHNYNGGHDGLSDLQWGLAHGKKVILEEFGFSNTGDRTTLAKTDIDFWKSQGVSAALQWGFLGKGMVDNGNGDTLYGMDTIWHTDYDSLANLYAVYNNVSLPTPIVTPTQAVTPTPTFAPSTWIINVEPVCPSGTTLTGKTRIFYAIWPMFPVSSKLTWQHDDYAVGLHTQQIAATAPQGSGAIQGIYVGMETENGTNLSPLGTPPNPSITYANYFKILMAHWFWNELPSGYYDLKFNAPSSICDSATSAPTSAPAPTAPNPVVSCNPNPTSENDRFLISWTNNANPVTFADIAPANGFNTNIFYNKSVIGVASSPASATAPGAFNDQSNNSPLSLAANTTYYVRLFNGVAQTQVAGYGTFNSSSCSYNNPSPTINQNPTPTLSVGVSGDVNGDGKIDLVDMSVIFSRWGKTGDATGKADINRDGIVNSFDYSLLLSHF